MLGKEYCKIDNNGRFKFPIALKRQLGTEDCRFVIRPSIYADCLELWTYSNFEVELANLNKKLNPYSIEDRKLRRKLTEVNIIEMDSNDRLVIPNEQRGRLSDSKDIVLLPTCDCIEIWTYDKYCQVMEDGTDYAAMADSRLGHNVEENGPTEQSYHQ